MGKSKAVLKNIFNSLTKQHFKIKITAYLCLLWLLKDCNTISCSETSVLLRCIEVRVHSKPWMSEQYFVPARCFYKTAYKNSNNFLSFLFNIV
jgi:hypothetical protein